MRLLGWFDRMMRPPATKPTTDAHDPELAEIQAEGQRTRRDVVDKLARRGVRLEFDYADRVMLGLPERRVRPRPQR